MTEDHITEATIIGLSPVSRRLRPDAERFIISELPHCNTAIAANGLRRLIEKAARQDKRDFAAIESAKDRFEILSLEDAAKAGFDVIIDPYDDFGWCLVDHHSRIVMGYDGGEVEDQLLVRDWAWVAPALNEVWRESAGR